MDQISLCISRNKAGTLPKNVPKNLSKIFWGFAWEGLQKHFGIIFGEIFGRPTVTPTELIFRNGDRAPKNFSIKFSGKIFGGGLGHQNAPKIFSISFSAKNSGHISGAYESVIERRNGLCCISGPGPSVFEPEPVSLCVCHTPPLK